VPWSHHRGGWPSSHGLICIFFFFLQKLLGDPKLVKVGVGIQDDVKKIKRDFDVLVQGWYDLSSIAPRARRMGLAALTKDHLNTILPKNKQLVMTKWSQELSPPKRAYAARDAYVSVLLLTRLVAMKLQVSSNSNSNLGPVFQCVCAHWTVILVLQRHTCHMLA